MPSVVVAVMAVMETAKAVNERGTERTAEKLPILRSGLILTFIMLGAFPLFATWGHVHDGLAGVAASAVAGGVCWGGCLVALVLAGWFRDPKHFLYGWLLGLVFRMVIPFMVGLGLAKSGGPLAEAGVFGMIVVYYLIGLTAETSLAVWLRGSRDGGITGVL